MTPHTDWEKKYFEANLLDGEDIHDCGGAMLRASEVWTVVEELLSHAVAEERKQIAEKLKHTFITTEIEATDRLLKFIYSLTPPATGKGKNL